MAHQQMTAVHVLLRFLEAEGVDTIFGVPGGPITPLYEALYDRGQIRHVLAKHEEGATSPWRPCHTRCSPPMTSLSCLVCAGR
jgi:glyoxylate carboligase